MAKALFDRKGSQVYTNKIEYLSNLEMLKTVVQAQILDEVQAHYKQLKLKLDRLGEELTTNKLDKEIERAEEELLSVSTRLNLNIQLTDLKKMNKDEFWEYAKTQAPFLSKKAIKPNSVSVDVNTKEESDILVNNKETETSKKLLIPKAYVSQWKSALEKQGILDKIKIGVTTYEDLDTLLDNQDNKGEHVNATENVSITNNHNKLQSPSLSVTAQDNQHNTKKASNPAPASFKLNPSIIAPVITTQLENWLHNAKNPTQQECQKQITTLVEQFSSNTSSYSHKEIQDILSSKDLDSMIAQEGKNRIQKMQTALKNHGIAPDKLTAKDAVFIECLYKKYITVCSLKNNEVIEYSRTTFLKKALGLKPSDSLYQTLATSGTRTLEEYHAKGNKVLEFIQTELDYNYRSEFSDIIGACDNLCSIHIDN
jgi:hypothetical protein